jgi:hypothetical protein
MTSAIDERKGEVRNDTAEDTSTWRKTSPSSTTSSSTNVTRNGAERSSAVVGRRQTVGSTLTRIEFSSHATQMSAKHTTVQMVCAGQSRVRITGRERDFPEVFSLLGFYAA